MSTDQEFAEFLRQFPRELSEEEVHHRGTLRAIEQGPYVNPHANYHHFGEGAH